MKTVQINEITFKKLKEIQSRYFLKYEERINLKDLVHQAIILSEIRLLSKELDL